MKKVKCPKCGSDKNVHNMGMSDSIDEITNYLCSGCGCIWQTQE